MKKTSYSVLLLSLIFLSFLGIALPIKDYKPQFIRQLVATAKTQDVSTQGDSADDSAIYINEVDAKKSLIIGTNKQAGLIVYDLDGEKLQEFPDGELNNVDIRYDFSWLGKNVALIAASNRSYNTIEFYYVDHSQKVQKLEAGTHEAGLEVYGLCMYKDKIKNEYYVFVNSKNGEVIQWKIEANDDSKFYLTKARELKLATQTEGCVADDEHNKLYISEETVGIWQYEATPESILEPVLIDSVSLNGNLVADVEGLAIYNANNKDGYLLASSQGESAFNVYSRKTLKFIGKFQVNYKGKKIQNTDGIAVSSNYLGHKYPFGIIVVQDGNKTNEYQNFKMVPWGALAFSFFPPLHFIAHDSVLD